MVRPAFVEQQGSEFPKVKLMYQEAERLFKDCYLSCIHRVRNPARICGLSYSCFSQALDAAILAFRHACSLPSKNPPQTRDQLVYRCKEMTRHAYTVLRKGRWHGEHAPPLLLCRVYFSCPAFHRFFPRLRYVQLIEWVSTGAAWQSRADMSIVLDRWVW